MAMLFDLVKVNIPTAGTGDVTFGAPFSPGFFAPDEVGAVDGNTPRYIIVDGDDVEMGVGLIKSTVTQMERTVLRSRIGGIAGTSKINLSGTAFLAFTAAAADIINPADPAALDKLGFGATGKQLAAAADEAAAQNVLDISDGWAVQPIGVPIPLFSNMAGAALPPTNKEYRYALLTAGQTGSGQYNNGVLDSESVSGSAPLVIASARISLATSPLHNQTISLINTERRFLRAGSPGTVENDAIQSHRHPSVSGFIKTGPYGTIQSPPGSAFGVVGSESGGNVQDMGWGDGRMATETRPKNVGAIYFMRVM